MDLTVSEEFYQAFWWLQEHPLFRYKGIWTDSSFPSCLTFSPQKVDPQTRRIEKDKSRNTHVEIWIEVRTYEDPKTSEIPKEQIFSEWYTTGIPCHDYKLDCGGDTFELAIIALAKKVKEREANS